MTQIQIINQLINDIVKPWQDLNEILAKHYAVQPDLSDFTKRVNDIAIAISHFPEQLGKTRAKQSLFNDIADTAKHAILRERERETQIRIASCFLCNENDNYCFIRNIPFVSYRNRSDIVEVDFILESLIGIKNILSPLEIKINKELIISEFFNPEFTDTARLKFDSQYCVHMSSTNVRFFKKTDNLLVPYNPKKVNLEVFE